MKARGGTLGLVVVAALLAGYAGPAAADAGAHRQLALTVDDAGGLHPGDHFAGGTVRKADAALHMVVLDVGASDDARPGRHGIRSREDDPKLHLAMDGFTPDDPLLASQYAPTRVGAPLAWSETLGGSSASVCVVDTGVRSTHQALAGNWAGGWNVLTGTASPADDNGHGTHVAGIAAAGIDDGVGTAGMANVPLYGVKALDRTGSGAFSDVALGIKWCADHAGPHAVISMSLGASVGSTAVSAAVDYATAAGDLIVAAAGNDGCTGCIEFPASLPGVIAVTCTDSLDRVCSFSSRGAKAEVAAPGSLILSAWDSSDSSYAFLSGTSMSTPLVPDRKA